MTYRGHIKNGAVVLDDDVTLPEGTEVRLEPVAHLAPGVDEKKRKPRQLGTMRGTVLYMAPDFDAPLEDFKEYMA